MEQKGDVNQEQKRGCGSRRTVRFFFATFRACDADGKQKSSRPPAGGRGHPQRSKVACVQVSGSEMRSFECLKGAESVWALTVKKDKRRRRRKEVGVGGCPVMLKLGAFEKQVGERYTGRRGKEEEKKRRERARASLPRQSEGVVGGGGGGRGGWRGRNRPARAQQWGRIHMVLPALE